jgi:uncharacterized membrane protein YkoI
LPAIQHQFNRRRHSVESEQPALHRGDEGVVDTVKRLLAVGLLLLAAAAGNLSAATLTLRDAIKKVQHETGAKVLSAETKHAGRRTIYRIKVLTRDGQVKVIEVPATD